MTTPTLTSFAASRQSRLAFVPSKPTQVGLEPRHSPPLEGAPPAARQSRLRGSRSGALVHASRVPLAPWRTRMKLEVVWVRAHRGRFSHCVRARREPPGGGSLFLLAQEK